MTELLLCPFCGGEAKIRESSTHDFYVKCTKCGASTRRNHENRPGALIDWNTRVNDGETAKTSDNAPLRTCENANTDGYGFRFKCSECGYSSIVHNCETRLDELPSYCPNCGAKLVDE